MGNWTPVRVVEDFSSRRMHKDESSGEVAQSWCPGEYQQHVEQLFLELDFISGSCLPTAERPKKAPDQYVNM